MRRQTEYEPAPGSGRQEPIGVAAPMTSPWSRWILRGRLVPTHRDGSGTCSRQTGPADRERVLHDTTVARAAAPNAPVVVQVALTVAVVSAVLGATWIVWARWGLGLLLALGYSLADQLDRGTVRRAWYGPGTPMRRRESVIIASTWIRSCDMSRPDRKAGRERLHPARLGEERRTSRWSGPQRRNARHAVGRALPTSSREPKVSAPPWDAQDYARQRDR